MSVVCTLAKHDETGLWHTPGSNRLQAMRLSIKPWRSTVSNACTNIACNKLFTVSAHLPFTHAVLMHNLFASSEAVAWICSILVRPTHICLHVQRVRSPHVYSKPPTGARSKKRLQPIRFGPGSCKCEPVR